MMGNSGRERGERKMGNVVLGRTRGEEAGDSNVRGLDARLRGRDFVLEVALSVGKILLANSMCLSVHLFLCLLGHVIKILPSFVRSTPYPRAQG